jgi:hypothetical protein
MNLDRIKEYVSRMEFKEIWNIALRLNMASVMTKFYSAYWQWILSNIVAE